METLMATNKQTIFEETFELLEKTKTNWSVEKKPLFSECGLPTGSYGNFRNDNNSWLGTVTKNYVVMQNATLAENLIEASIDVSKKFRGGLLDSGRKIYYQAEIENEQIANDTIKRYVTILNSHDSTSSIGFGFTNKVVICQNTFHMAMREVQKIRHAKSANERIEIARKEIKIILEAENLVMDNFKRMADTKITANAKKKIIANLFDIEEEDLGKEEAEFSTKKVNQMKNFAKILDSELDSHGKTLWGLFNAVTYKTNHEDGKEGKRLDNVMYGAGYTKNLQAYKILVDCLPTKV
jgi:phage/plasmid-like protein (TIGR03299 family)